MYDISTYTFFLIIIGVYLFLLAYFCLYICSLYKRPVSKRVSYLWTKGSKRIQCV